MPRSRRLVFVVSGLLAAIVVAGLLGERSLREVWGLLVFVATCTLIIPLHELGHATFGQLVGLRVARVIVGKGRVLFKTRIAGVTWQVCIVPLGGATLAVPVEGARSVRARLWFFALGGPVVDAAVALAAWRLHGAFRGGSGSWLLETVATAAATQLAFDLYPGRSKYNGVEIGSDGRQLLTIPFMKPEAVARTFAGSYVVAGAEAGEQGDHRRALELFEQGLVRHPDAAALRQLRSFSLSKLGRFAEAKAGLEPLFADPDRRVQAVAFNDWSWYTFSSRDEADLGLADRRSATAVERLPELGAAAGTRGAILLWQGRVSEAVPLLQRGYASSSGASAGGSDAALLAIAHAARGDEGEARRWLDRARARAGQSPLVEEAEAAIARVARRPHRFAAARGGRALVVHAQHVELVEGRGPATRVALDEIAALDVGLTARGRALLVVARGGRRWRLPLATSDLGAARLALAPWFERHVRPRPPSPVAVAATRSHMRLVGQLAAVATTLAVMFGRGARGDDHLQSALVLTVGLVAMFSPGPAPLLAMGMSTLLGLGLLVAGPGDAGIVFDAAAWLWLVAQAVLGGLLLAAFWSAVRAGPATRKEGYRATVGFLALVAGFPVILLALILVRHSTHALTLSLASFRSETGSGIAALTLGTVLVVLSSRRWRLPALALMAVGVLWVGVSRSSARRPSRASQLGPEPPALTWTQAPAVVVRRAELPPRTTWVAVSPGGTAFVARVVSRPTGSGPAPQYDDEDDDDDDYDGDDEIVEGARPAAAGARDAGAKPAPPTMLVGAFAEAPVAVPGRQAGFLDDGRLLILDHDLDHDAGAWRAREVAVDAPHAPLRVAVLPPRGLAFLFFEEPTGIVRLGLTARGELAGAWTWSSPAGLIPVAVTKNRLALFPWSAMARCADVPVQCAGKQRGSARWLCSFFGSTPVDLVSLDAETGACERLASVPRGYPPARVLRDGRLIIGRTTDLAVVDLAARRGTILTLPRDDDAPSRLTLTASGLAVLRTRFADRRPVKTELLVLGAPQ